MPGRRKKSEATRRKELRARMQEKRANDAFRTAERQKNTEEARRRRHRGREENNISRKQQQHEQCNKEASSMSAAGSSSIPPLPKTVDELHVNRKRKKQNTCKPLLLMSQRATTATPKRSKKSSARPPPPITSSKGLIINDSSGGRVSSSSSSSTSSEEELSSESDGDEDEGPPPNTSHQEVDFNDADDISGDDNELGSSSSPSAATKSDIEADEDGDDDDDSDTERLIDYMNLAKKSRTLGKDKQKMIKDKGENRIFRVDTKTGSVFYPIPIPPGGSQEINSTSANLELEFRKQADTSYKCVQCSRIVAYGKAIPEKTMRSHVHRFHPSGRTTGVCPVCDMPVPSVTNSKYYDHRLTHLSESEKSKALANPVLRQYRAGKYSSYPRLPPMEKRRKMTPELASLRGDVSQCPACGKFVTGGPQGLERHEQTHLPREQKRIYLCATCGAGFTVKHALDMHILKSHPEGNGDAKPFKCPHCPREYKTEKFLKIHLDKEGESHSSSGDVDLVKQQQQHQFPCSKCSSSFPTRNGLNKHISHKHCGVPKAGGSHYFRAPGYSCKYAYCRQSFENKEERQVHYTTSHGNSKEATQARHPHMTVRCMYPSCTLGFPDEVHLQSHVSQEHGRGPPPPQPSSGGGSMCFACGRVLVNEQALRDHSLIHSHEKRHVCPRCPLLFRVRSSLVAHLAAIHGEGPLAGHFRCEEPACGKVYQSRKLYRDHLRSVHHHKLGGRRRGGKAEEI